MADQTSAQSPEKGLLVPVGKSATLRNTVAHAIEVASEAGLDEVHFVTPVPWHGITDVAAAIQKEPRELLDRVSTWAGEDVPDNRGSVVTARRVASLEGTVVSVEVRVW